jgi:large repetitive protein
MMTVSLREAHSSKHRFSLAAVRSTLLLMLLALFAGSALAQSLTPGGPVNFGSVELQQTATSINLIFTAPPVTGTTITAITAVTEGLTGKDFKVVPGSDCIGKLNPHQTCTISLTFTPEQIGLRLGALTVTDSTNTVVNLVYLYGVGVGPQFVFQPATASAVDTATTVGSFTPGSAVQDPNNNIIFLDVANNRILEESPATPPATPVFSQIYPVLPSTTTTLTLSNTSGLAIDGTGTLYVSSGTSVVSLAPGATTFTPVSITGVTLKSPAGLAVDPFGDLYIADTANNAVYLVPEGGGAASALPLTGLTAPPTLSGPTGLAVGEVNNQITLYIADTGNNRIVEISLTGSPAATVLALNTLTLNHPTGVGVDAAGTVYIADTGNQRIVEATIPGDQFVLATNNVPAFTLGNPVGVLTDVSTGDVVVSDTTLGLVTFVRTAASVNFPTPTEVGTLDTTDDPETLTIQGTGNIVSSLSPSFTGTNPTAFLVSTTPTTPTPCPPPGTFGIGEVCTYDLNFQPTVVGPNLANLVLTAAAAGVAPFSNSASLTGIGFTTLTHFSLVAISVPPTTPTTINLNDSVELVLTALNSNNTVAKDYSGDITFTTSDANGKYQGGTAPGTNTSIYTMTLADNGVLTIPVASGLQLNQYGVWTATATVTNPATLPPTVISDTATSNDIFVIEPATLKLTSSINPTAVNQSTTFTLTITATGPSPITPTGTVTFFSNGVQIGTPVNVTGTGAVGTASIPDSFATPGSYNITATYTPTSFTQGGSATLTQVVGNASSVTLTSSINPSLVGQSTNLTATITSSPTFGAATGTVQFFDGGAPIGAPVNVSGSAATLPFAFTTAGNHTLTAVYTSTNPNLTGATSGPYIQHVLNVATLLLTSSVNPSTPGQSTTLTATLTTLTTTPGGTIKFYDGTTLIGTVTLPTNSISVSFTTPGNHILTAVYSGDATTETITSPPLTQVVLYATTATLTSSVNPVDVNANTTLTATVKSSSGTPTGTVTFKSNGVTIGTGTLSGGVATLVTSFKLPGTYTLVAVYGGDANNQPATTNTVLETVLNVVNISLTSSVNPVFLDNPTVLTATVTTAAAGTAPTGTVNFFDGTTPIGSGTIVNGMVSITASFVYAGPHSITAVFAGDAQDVPATSPPLTQTVADFSLTVATGGSSSASTIAGGTATYNLVVTPLITSTFPGPITLTFSGLPTTVTGTLTPTTIATGSGTTPVALAVTADTLLQLGHLQRPPVRRSPMRYAPITLALLALPLAWFRRRQRFASLFASILLLLAITAGVSGCAAPANTGYYGETPNTYNLTVTATSGNLSRSVYLTLTVQ